MLGKINPGIVLGIIAVILAMSGSALAGGYIITSTKQIKPSVRQALRGARGPQGFTGAQGPQGIQGIQGPQGSAGITSITVVNGPENSYCAFGSGCSAVASSEADCPPGSRALGGAGSASSIEAHVSTSVGPTSYFAIVNNDGPYAGTVQAQAVCASGPGVRSLTRSASTKTDVDEMVARLREQQAGATPRR